MCTLVLYDSTMHVDGAHKSFGSFAVDCILTIDLQIDLNYAQAIGVLK